MRFDSELGWEILLLLLVYCCQGDGAQGLTMIPLMPQIWTQFNSYASALQDCWPVTLPLQMSAASDQKEQDNTLCHHDPMMQGPKRFLAIFRLGWISATYWILIINTLSYLHKMSYSGSKECVLPKNSWWPLTYTKSFKFIWNQNYGKDLIFRLFLWAGLGIVYFI